MRVGEQTVEEHLGFNNLLVDGGIRSLSKMLFFCSLWRILSCIIDQAFLPNRRCPTSTCTQQWAITSVGKMKTRSNKGRKRKEIGAKKEKGASWEWRRKNERRSAKNLRIFTKPAHHNSFTQYTRFEHKKMQTWKVTSHKRHLSTLFD